MSALAPSTGTEKTDLEQLPEDVRAIVKKIVKEQVD